MTKHGWCPSLPDRRHIPFVPKAAALAKYIDLRPTLPPAWDQGSIGSCTAHAVAVGHMVAQQLSGLKPIMPSRLALYFNGRAARGWQNLDSGACIVDVVKSTFKLGVAEEKLYPYLVTKIKLKPPASVYANALLHQATQYQKVDNTKQEDIVSALELGCPVIFGTTLYEGHNKLSKANVMPKPNLKAKAIGGHAMAICGWDEKKSLFLVRNSWSTSWGDSGYHWMHASVITDLSLSDDFWIIVRTEK